MIFEMYPTHVPQNSHRITTQDLITGGTSMRTLCGMSTDDLAASHIKAERKRIRDESYAGHLRQEDEGNEIVYKDGALQKIDQAKSEATKQVRRSSP